MFVVVSPSRAEGLVAGLWISDEGGTPPAVFDCQPTAVQNIWQLFVSRCSAVVEVYLSPAVFHFISLGTALMSADELCPRASTGCDAHAVRGLKVRWTPGTMALKGFPQMFADDRACWKRIAHGTAHLC